MWLQVPPLRIVRALHTLLLSLELQGKVSATAKAGQLDSLLYALARHVGSDSLDASATLQAGLLKEEDALIAQVVGYTPEEHADAQTCCVSLLNDIDMGVAVE